MFQVIVIKLNKYSDFNKSLWDEREKVKEFCSVVDSDNLQSTLNTIYNPEYKKEKLDLNTVDVLFTRDYTYQLVYSCEEEDKDIENYLGGAINYKRKPLSGTCVLVKIKIVEVSKKIVYKEASMTINEDIELIIQDMFFHIGFKISDKMEPIMFSNKYNIKNSDVILDKLPSYELNIFGIPIRIWGVEGNPPTNALSYLKDISNFLGKKVSEIYITSAIYPNCKCLSLDKKITQQIIELITRYPDEGELKDICVAYNYASKAQRTENIYIVFDDFFWKVTKET
jgi:hypothetical protein